MKSYTDTMGRKFLVSLVCRLLWIVWVMVVGEYIILHRGFTSVFSWLALLVMAGYLASLRNIPVLFNLGFSYLELSRELEECKDDCLQTKYISLEVEKVGLFTKSILDLIEKHYGVTLRDAVSIYNGFYEIIVPMPKNVYDVLSSGWKASKLGTSLVSVFETLLFMSVTSLIFFL